MSQTALADAGGVRNPNAYGQDTHLQINTPTAITDMAKIAAKDLVIHQATNLLIAALSLPK
jgi:hypothetical protein